MIKCIPGISELADSSETANSPQPDPKSAYLEWCNINDNSSAIHPTVNESVPKPSYVPNRRSNRVRRQTDLGPAVISNMSHTDELHMIMNE